MRRVTEEKSNVFRTLITEVSQGCKLMSWIKKRFLTSPGTIAIVVKCHCLSDYKTNKCKSQTKCVTFQLNCTLCTIFPTAHMWASEKEWARVHGFFFQPRRRVQSRTEAVAAASWPHSGSREEKEDLLSKSKEKCIWVWSATKSGLKKNIVKTCYKCAEEKTKKAGKYVSVNKYHYSVTLRREGRSTFFLASV